MSLQSASTVRAPTGSAQRFGDAMHVLVLPSWYGTPEVPWNGIFFEHQAVALARAGARVGVTFVETRSLRSLSPAKLRESHFQVVSSEEGGVMSLRMKGWNTAAQTTTGARLWTALSERLVRRYVRRFGVPDLIHAHAALWAGRVAVRMARSLSRPCVVTEHSSGVLLDTLGPKARREARRIYLEADAVLAVSNAMSAAVNSIARAPVARMLPNAIDFTFFTLPPVLRRPVPFTFVCVCNLVSNKRVDRLIRAFASVSLGGPDVRLMIVGDGPEAEYLRLLASECGVASLVEFTGGLPREGVRECLWRANALVLPSAFETFGVVLVEALATGIPVVSTRCGGPEDIVDEGLGLLVDPNDENALGMAMRAVITRKYSENALRDRAKNRYSFEAVAQDLLGVYERIRARQSTRSSSVTSD